MALQGPTSSPGNLRSTQRPAYSPRGLRSWAQTHQGPLDPPAMAGERAARNAGIADVPDDMPDVAHPTFICNHDDRELAYQELSMDANNAVSAACHAFWCHPLIPFTQQGTALERLTDAVYISFIARTDYASKHFSQELINMTVSVPRVARRSMAMKAAINEMAAIFRVKIAVPVVLTHNERQENIVPTYHMQHRLAHLSLSSLQTLSPSSVSSAPSTPSSVSTQTTATSTF